MTLKLGELFAGYGGLGMAVEQVFNAELAWVSENEPAPSKILAHHWPTVPNHGDITKINWADVEPVDILSGGFPCQDVSLAGRRRGLGEGTRTGLWAHFAKAIEIIRPRYVVAENVRGILSARADSNMEHCPECLAAATRRKGHALRALGAVLGDLAERGYDAQWTGIKASDVGAPHQRFRVVILATNRDDAGRSEHRRPLAIQEEHATTEHTGPDAADADRGQRDRRQRYTLRHQGSGETTARTGEGLLTDAAPADALRSGGGRRTAIPGDGEAPRADTTADRADYRPDQSGTATATETPADAGGEARQQRHGLREGLTEGQRRERPADDGRLIAPTDAEGQRRREGWTQSTRIEGGPDTPLGVGTDWGQYETAIRRWERILGRPAPAPTEPTGRNGNHRLSPAFTEWMMGVPAGHITDPAIGLTRNQQLKACGNGVVPQQAAEALHHLLTIAPQLGPIS